MRKYLLPSALILLLGLGVALAQTITRAVQLSQDTSGAFSVDSTNGLYLPGHLLSIGSPIPSITGTGTPTVTGTDFAGVVTMGSSGTTATVAFGRAYLSNPWCVATWQSGSPSSYTPATTSISFAQIASSGNRINYICSGAS